MLWLSYSGFATDATRTETTRTETTEHGIVWKNVFRKRKIKLKPCEVFATKSAETQKHIKAARLRSFRAHNSQMVGHRKTLGMNKAWLAVISEWHLCRLNHYISLISRFKLRRISEHSGHVKWRSEITNALAEGGQDSVHNSMAKVVKMLTMAF